MFDDHNHSHAHGGHGHSHSHGKAASKKDKKKVEEDEVSKKSLADNIFAFRLFLKSLNWKHFVALFLLFMMALPTLEKIWHVFVPAYHKLSAATFKTAQDGKPWLVFCKEEKGVHTVFAKVAELARETEKFQTATIDCTEVTASGKTVFEEHVTTVKYPEWSSRAAFMMANGDKAELIPPYFWYEGDQTVNDPLMVAGTLHQYVEKAAAKTVIGVINQAQFKNTCLNKLHCLFVLRHGKIAGKTQTVLNEVMDQYRGLRFSTANLDKFDLWLGEKGPALEATAEPTIVFFSQDVKKSTKVLASKREKPKNQYSYAVYKGNFNADDIAEFIAKQLAPEATQAREQLVTTPTLKKQGTPVPTTSSAADGPTAEDLENLPPGVRVEKVDDEFIIRMDKKKAEDLKKQQQQKVATEDGVDVIEDDE